MKHGFSRKRSPRQRKTLDAALSCFLEHGFEATTMERIRESSGASNGSIYHHFGSKKALALALYQEGIRDYQTAVLGALYRQTTAQEGIRALVISHLSWTAGHSDLSLYLTRVGTADALVEMAARVEELNRDIHRDVHAWISPFIEAGEVIRVHPVLYFPLIVGPATQFLRHWLQGRMPFDPAEVAEDLAGAAWRSLRMEVDVGGESAHASIE